MKRSEYSKSLCVSWQLRALYDRLRVLSGHLAKSLPERSRKCSETLASDLGERLHQERSRYCIWHCVSWKVRREHRDVTERGSVRGWPDSLRFVRDHALSTQASSREGQRDGARGWGMRLCKCRVDRDGSNSESFARLFGPNSLLEYDRIYRKAEGPLL